MWISLAIRVPFIVAPANVGESVVFTPWFTLPSTVVTRVEKLPLADSNVVILVESEPLADSNVVVLVEKLELTAVNEPEISSAICADELTRVLSNSLSAVVNLVDIEELTEVIEPLTADLKSESVKSIARVLVDVISPPPVKPVPAVIETPLWSIFSLAT